jgi:hypothetical protein
MLIQEKLSRKEFTLTQTLADGSTIKSRFTAPVEDTAQIAFDIATKYEGQDVEQIIEMLQTRENISLESRTSYNADGKRHGLSEIWYENGQIFSRSEWKNDKCHGAYEEWHGNGALKRKGTYEDGQRIGAWYDNEDPCDVKKVRYADGTDGWNYKLPYGWYRRGEDGYSFRAIRANNEKNLYEYVISAYTDESARNGGPVLEFDK